MKKLLLCTFLLCSFVVGYSFGGYVSESDTFKVDFELVNNIMVIPIQVNNVTLSFVLDTGAGHPILFNSTLTDSLLTLNNSKKVYLKGVGSLRKIPAIKSLNNVFKVGGATNKNQKLYVVNDVSANFSPQLGVPIHGVIGYDLLKDFVIEINYISKKIKFITNASYVKKRCRTCETLPFYFYNKKPYVTLLSTINKKAITTKLLVDTGNSDALWLFENDSLGISCSKTYFNDFLGYGLSGNIYGKRSKIDALSLNTFTLKNIKVAFPNAEIVAGLNVKSGRNGSVGGELLKRFKVVLDYKNRELVLKRNRNFNTPFNYNKSGVVLEDRGIGLVLNNYAITAIARNLIKIKPLIKVFSVRENSPAQLAGLRKGDIVLSVNNKSAKYHSMHSIQGEFYKEVGDKVAMVIERYGAKFNIFFKLESPFIKMP